MTDWEGVPFTLTFHTEHVTYEVLLMIAAPVTSDVRLIATITAGEFRRLLIDREPVLRG